MLLDTSTLSSGYDVVSESVVMLAAGAGMYRMSLPPSFARVLFAPQPQPRWLLSPSCATVPALLPAADGGDILSGKNEYKSVAITS